MNELIQIKYDNDRPTVSARELHSFLEIDTPYRLWFPRMCEYGFTEKVDYTPYFFVHPQNKQQTEDHQLTIAMAKEICMLQRNEKGKQARQYFIKLEEEWNSPDKVMARALIMSQKTIEQLRTNNTMLTSKIEQDKPKVMFADAVSASKTSILIGDLAKLLKQNGYDIGQKRLFEKLRQDGYLIKGGSSQNMPTQKAMERGLFEVKETSIANPDGSIRITRTTKVTGKGQQYFINKLLKTTVQN